MEFVKRIIDYDDKLPVRIACFSDTQFGSRYFSRKHFLKWIKKQSVIPQTYFLTIGDNIEAITTKDKRFSLEHLDPNYFPRYFNNPTSKFWGRPDALVDAQIEDFVETVTPHIRPDQWIGIGRGNHDDTIRLRHGSDPQARLAEMLGTKDLGYSWLLTLCLRPQKGGNGRSRTITFYGHHGWGAGSRTSGGDITKFERLLIDYDADIYLTGHTHKPFAMPFPRVGIDRNGKMVSRDRWLANTGSFMKLLADGPVPSWAETKGFRVVKLGGLVWELVPLRQGWIDVEPVTN